MKSKICLVIPYYEAAEGLLRSLESVNLRSDDVVLVIDDGSRKFPASAFCPSQVGQTPVRLVTLPQNQGIAGALIAGMAEVPDEAKYVSRLDCGDICKPERFELQREFLDRFSDCSIVGSWVSFVDPKGAVLYTQKLPTLPDPIRSYMRINSALIHPAVTFRKSAYEKAGGYSALYPAAEDYALFRKMIQSGDAANIDRVLVDCLTSVGGISDAQRTRQLRTRLNVMIENFDWHPLSYYGVLRAVIQMATPRTFSTWVRMQLERIRSQPDNSRVRTAGISDK